MTKGQFKQLHNKLDSILDSSQAFSSSKWENLLNTHRATVEMLTYANSKVIEESTKAAQASDKKITEAMEKVSLLESEVKEFMADFRVSSDKSTTDMNKVIEAFGSYLKYEREALSMIYANIKLDNVDLNSTITTQLDNLKVDLATKNKIMGGLAEQIHKEKVLNEN